MTTHSPDPPHFVLRAHRVLTHSGVKRQSRSEIDNHRSAEFDDQIRFLAIDLDGTLVDRFGVLYEGAISGLRGLRDVGVTAMIVTGRSATGFAELLEYQELVSVVEDVLLTDGSVSLAPSTGAVAILDQCPSELVTRLWGIAGAEFVADTGEGLMASTRRAAAAYAVGYHVNRSRIEVRASGATQPDAVASFIVFSTPVSLESITADLLCEVAAIGAFGARVVRPIGGGKLPAVTAYLQRCYDEPDLSRTLALGDGHGDIGLLARSAVGIATREAPDDVVAASNAQLTWAVGAFLDDLGWSREH